LGVIPNGTAVHIIQKSQDGKWGMIALTNGVGWVSTHYLAAMTSTPNTMPSADPQTAPDGGPLPANLNGFPLGITCSGTEPFWSLTVANDRTVRYNSLIDGPDPATLLTQATQSIGGGYPFNFVAQPYAGSLNAQACSDGMSDIGYSMSILLTRPSGNGASQTLHGCCNVD
jgi:uncharacterized membrane protein